METQAQLDGIHFISHTHANGEMFEADNIEAARAMCPKLGTLTLEEAGLLLELEAMGKEQIAGQQNVSREKPVIEKIEKVQPKHNEIKKPAERIVRATENVTVSNAEVLISQVVPLINEEQSGKETRRPEADDSHVVSIPHPEFTHIFPDSSNSVEVVEAARVEEKRYIENLFTAPNVAEARLQANIEVVEVTDLLNAQQEIRVPTPVAREFSIHQPDEIASDQFLVIGKAAEPEIVHAVTNVMKTELSQVDEMLTEPVLFEHPELIVATEISDLEIFTADEPSTDVNLFEAVEDLLSIVSHEEHTYEKQIDQESLPITLETALAADEEPDEFIGIETNPLLIVPELPAPIPEIENTIEQLMEVIEKDGDEESEKVMAIIKTIITLPARAELALDNSAEASFEKIEELFIELFEEINISYTPELIKSFVKLTTAHYLEDLLELTTYSKEEAKILPEEIGTREFLQKLQKNLHSMKQAIINFYELGKSILRLYSFST